MKQPKLENSPVRMSAERLRVMHGFLDVFDPDTRVEVLAKELLTEVDAARAAESELKNDLRALIDAVPKCGRDACPKPSTRRDTDDDDFFCDEHGHEEDVYYEDTDWAPTVRKVCGSKELA